MNKEEDDQQLLLQRKVEEDTHILGTNLLRIGGILTFLERWVSDGVTGSSIVLLTRDVGQMSDEELKQFLAQEPRLNLQGSVTITRRETHTFVNFGFEID
jgi:hypothetical protein